MTQAKPPSFGRGISVQPDITMICDKQKINEKGIKGTPDWIIEIIIQYSQTRLWN